MSAAVDVFWAHPSGQISLDEVARRAGVSPRTVIRRFGGRRGLLNAAAERELERTRDERDEAQAGDTAGAVTILVDHYELAGDRVLKLLAAETNEPSLTGFVDTGRELHRDWCERIFESALEGLSHEQRQRRLAQFVSICDVYTWKLLRRDAGLSRKQTELALVEMLEPMMEGFS